MRLLACIWLLMMFSYARCDDFAPRKLQLPGATGFVILDYAYDSRHQKLWVPAGNLGLTAVIDGKTDQITMVGGFKTSEVELRGRKWVMGPS